MTRVLLIRHGESLANRQSIFAGQINPPLTDLGKTQAERTAKFIKENYTVDAAYASDLDRAWETGLAAANALGLPLHKEPGFREIFAGDWEGRTFEEIEARYPIAYHCWRENIGHAETPGGETVLQLYDRVSDALRRTAEAHPGKTIVIATHATPIRLLMTALSGRSIEDAANTPWVSNASVTEITYDAGVWMLGKIGQDAHLCNLKTTFGSNV